MDGWMVGEVRQGAEIGRGIRIELDEKDSECV